MIVIYADSGAGKGIVVEYLLNKGYTYLRSNTTRERRLGEEDSYEYNFLTIEDFKNKIDNNEFIQYQNAYGVYYGTLKKDTLDLESKVSVLVAPAIEFFINEFGKDNIYVIYIKIEEERRHSFLKERGETNLKRFNKITSEDKEFIDYIINNNGTIDDIYDQVDEILVDINSNKKTL